MYDNRFRALYGKRLADTICTEYFLAYRALHGALDRTTCSCVRDSSVTLMIDCIEPSFLFVHEPSPILVHGTARTRCIAVERSVGWKSGTRESIARNSRRVV